MNTLVKRLASVQLTLGLLTALSIAAAFGTAIPQSLPPAEYPKQLPGLASLLLALGMDHFYQGWLFRTLLALFGANLLACGLRRSVDGWRGFLGRGKEGLSVPLAPGNDVEARLLAARFRILSLEPLVARRRCWAFLGFPLVHVAPLAILVGGLWGSVGGFVGTRNVRVGEVATSLDENGGPTKRQLPFELFAEDFRLRYYPIALQVKVIPPTGEAAEIITRVGALLDVDGTPWTVKILSFDSETGDLAYAVRERGKESWAGPFSRGREEGAPLRVQPLGYKDPDVRRAEATVSLWGAGGKRLARQVVAVNEPLVCDGLRIFLTAWGKDEAGNPFVGFQVSHDPGQWLLWTGAVALSLGLFLLLFGDGAWVREENGRLLARGTRGRRSLTCLTGPTSQTESSSRQQ